MKAKPVHVVLADPQYLIRLGLRHLFEGHPKIRVVDEAANSAELLDSVRTHHPDVVIFDYLRTPAFSIEDIAAVCKASPTSRFLVISDDSAKDSIFAALQSGALSFLTKECDEEEIVSAVIATSRGEKFLCNKVLDIILGKSLQEEDGTCSPTNLTVRELEIVKLTAQGHTARQVADKLFLSTHTVYTHRKNIMRKLGVNSASEMIVYAVNNGLAAST